MSKKKQSALLQEFVYPIEDKNCIIIINIIKVVIEVNWNNHIIQLSRRTNIHSMDDKIETYKKLLTYEKNSDHHITISNVDILLLDNVSHERVVKNINEICQNIRKRMNIIYHYKYVLTLFGEERTREKNFIEDCESEKIFLFLEKNILKSMILHFKVDEKCNIYLLYCLNIEFQDSNLKIVIIFNNI